MSRRSGSSDKSVGSPRRGQCDKSRAAGVGGEKEASQELGSWVRGAAEAGEVRHTSKGEEDVAMRPEAETEAAA